MSVVRNCIICDMSNVRFLSRYLELYFATCINCKVVFSRIIPNEKQLTKHYSSYSRTLEASTVTQRVYDNWIAEWKRRDYKSHLDFGCGSGELVKYALQNGIDSVGTEINDSVISKLKRSGVPAVKMSELLLSGRKFDVITLIEVLEHLPNPKEVLKQLDRILEKDGEIFITTPNFNSLNRFFFHENWRILSYPDHINMFSKSTLVKLLQEFGYSAERIKISGHTIRDKKILARKLAEKRILDVSNQREFFDRNRLTRFIKRFINLLLHLTKLGDSISMSAKRLNNKS